MIWLCWFVYFLLISSCWSPAFVRVASELFYEAASCKSLSRWTRPVQVLCQFLIAEHQKLKLGIFDATLPSTQMEHLPGSLLKDSKGST